MILYISTTKSALGALLAQNDNEGCERVVYYINHTLVGYELNYSPIECDCLEIFFTTQKLRHYMLNHQTMLFAKIDPLKYLLSKVALIGCMAKWLMVLSEYDIQYVERKAIKGQVIAN